ncbi:MAG: hypothetical protein A2381_18250 [Bdellovibrionales bacterium RIFOXYB1_FULL_37_110]|nr:MAG: hypothetical protein A2417_06715 [Bdellovibrionales bacterium RIFOXYC1_FULL_37_79]OFZ58614.1 MAG: hypothetical protein A2381_18250 [Bdellovibrionales bacterium RIFOXYB1_FULL_37_110]OFZ61724.1 MAG: hypothetical protein A2577_19440 [Bdellovibrionales bacterium RIFOXYD1_FULL_36_51]
MQQKEEKKATGKEKKLVYLGKDDNFWKTLQKAFKEIYPDKTFIFESLTFAAENEIKSLRKNIGVSLPQVLFLDNSLFQDEILRLTTDLQKDPATKHMILISLLPNLNSRAVIRKSLALGIKMNFIKGIDLLGIIHHSFKLAFPSELKKLELAVAKVQFEAVALNLFNIGYVTKDYIHVETNFIFSEGEELSFNTNIFNPISISGYFQVVKVYKTNLYTQYRLAYDLKFIHRNEKKLKLAMQKIEKYEGILKKDDKNADARLELSMANSEKLQIQKEEENNKQVMEKKLREWVTKHLEQSRPKRSRILIVDRELTLLNQIPGKLEEYFFSVRIRTSIDKDFKVIEQMFPGIIAYVLEDPRKDNQEEIDELSKKEVKKVVEREYNSIEALSKLVTKIKSCEGYRPFIILFNCYEKTDCIKETIGYERIMGTRGEITMDVIVEIVKKYEQMRAKNLSHATLDDAAKDEVHFYVSKFSEMSAGEYTFPINVLDISEGEIHFQSLQKIPPFATLYIKAPVKMTLTVVPEEDDEKKKKNKPTKSKGMIDYYALISGLGEIETSNLRKYVNELFFKDLKKQREEEKTKFLELNQQVLGQIDRKKQEEEN